MKVTFKLFIFRLLWQSLFHDLKTYKQDKKKQIQKKNQQMHSPPLELQVEKAAVRT